MTDKPSKNPSSIEAKLRQWGAAKAIDQAQQALEPIPKPQRRPIWFRRNTLAMAASFILLIMGGLMIHQLNKPDSPSITRTATAPSQIRRSEQMIQSPSLDRFENQLTDQQQRMLHLEFTVGQLPTTKQVQALASQLTQTHDQLKTLEKQVQTQQIVAAEQTTQLGRILTSQEQTQTSNAQLAQQVALLKRQVAKQKDQMQSVNALVQTMTQQLASLQKRDSQYVSDLQAMYLASAAPGSVGLASRQTAAREHRMLARLNAFYKQVDDPAMRKLLEQLEVSLTYLELMDVTNPQSAAHLQSMIEKNQVTQSIDRTLDSALGNTTLRTWLLEVRLILAGGQHAS